MIYEDLKGKKVLVTGSSSGIGAATAKMFAGQGCFVGVHYFRTKDGGEKTFAEVQKVSSGCLLKADMRDKKQVIKLIEDFVKQAGGIDVLVNNAGTLIERQDFAVASEEYYEDVFATNVKSAFLAAQAGLEELKKSKGCIVNLGSVAGHNGGAQGSGLYSAAKAAVATMTIAMAKEFAPFGIRVNSVMPGLIETRFHEQFSTAERRAAVAKETPLGRNGRAEDVAKAILFLASDAAGFITGEYIAVNGGLYMRA
ncbi:MAG: SDR family NAD(P)-dependent oxidoreductase [Phycisphaerae bacterium]|nr:SDR family NAD(P)-dependent oxidoreductase [Phycisphaerae bacterium]